MTTCAEIRCPLGKVSRFAANPDNAPLWYDNIKSVEWKTAKELTVGAQVAFVAHFLGKRLAYTYTIRTLTDTSMVMATSEGPFPMETTYTWESLDAHTTRMTLRNRGVPSGFSKIFAPLMGFMMKQANKKDLKKLKQILEQA
ncbi:SRPBCC family protein [Pontibacter sp. E15-1]|uniref:SRPBCC family protein n=1 Tax=Pontibacter sp. E15-1 TaxID=2919918 RepID=UPI00293F448E|nr:SRPBCC family protein [Pontibacter sp. E15-1]